MSNLNSQITAFFDRAKAKVGAATEKFINDKAKEILAKSQNYVPVDTGSLKASGRTDQEGGGFGTVTSVMYGGLGAVGSVLAATGRGGTGVGKIATSGQFVDYAVIVHERTDQVIRWTVPGTGAKYLERAVNEVVATTTGS